MCEVLKLLVVRTKSFVSFKRLGFNLENFVTGITPPKSILETNQAKNNHLAISRLFNPFLFKSKTKESCF